MPVTSTSLARPWTSSRTSCGASSASLNGDTIVSASLLKPSVDNPESTIDTFARQFQITQKEAQIVKEAFYLEQGPATMFHVINAFTKAAQDGRLTATDAYRLERPADTSWDWSGHSPFRCLID
jgi:hypothetical protein